MGIQSLWHAITDTFSIILGRKISRSNLEIIDPVVEYHRLRTELSLPSQEVRILCESEEMCMYMCGHLGPFKVIFDLYGQIRSTEGTEYLCPDCQKSFYEFEVIVCAHCGNLISPTDKVVLNRQPSLLIFKEYGWLIENQYICCTNEDCSGIVKQPTHMWINKKRGVVTLKSLKKASTA